MIDKILFKLLLLDGNETNMISEPITAILFSRLIIELVKVKDNIRYCTNKNCECHPETRIKELLSHEELIKFLNKYTKGIVKDIEKIINDYDPIIAKGIYEDD